MKIKRSAPALTAQELEIMKIVWARRQATVRDVYESMRERRRIAYTTVLTLMNILHGKGRLKRHLAGRAHVYQAAEPKQRTIGRMVHEFLDRVFNGSAEPLLMHLAEEERLTPADLEELAKTIRKKTS